MANRATQTPLPEERGSAYEGIRPGLSTLRRGLEINPAVHADAVCQRLLLSPGSGLLNLGQRLVDEGLPPKTGIDRHHQKIINSFQVRLDQGDGGGGD